METVYSSSLILIILISTGLYQGILSVPSPLSSLSFACALIRYESYLRRVFFLVSAVEVPLKAGFIFIHIFVLKAQPRMLTLCIGGCDQQKNKEQKVLRCHGEKKNRLLSEGIRSSEATHSV